MKVSAQLRSLMDSSDRMTEQSGLREELLLDPNKGKYFQA